MALATSISGLQEHARGAACCSVDHRTHVPVGVLLTGAAWSRGLATDGGSNGTSSDRGYPVWWGGWSCGEPGGQLRGQGDLGRRATWVGDAPLEQGQGLFAHVLSGTTKLPSFIVTLASFLFLQGVNLGGVKLLTGTTQVSGISTSAGYEPLQWISPTP